MFRWLTSSIPGPLLFWGMVVGIAGGSALLVKVLRRRYPEPLRESENRAVEFIALPSSYTAIGYFDYPTRPKTPDLANSSTA